MIFRLNDQVIDLNKLKYEYSLSDEMILNLELLDSKFNKVITIENLTSFYEYKDDDALIIYLAGFHNHTKRMLLKKIYSKYPNVKYYHFGDIDIGGLRIFNHLVESTGIPFIPLKMSVKELKDESNNLKELTLNDKKSLDLMLTDNRYIMFIDVMKYMKEHNVKLEQENLD